MSNYTNVKLSFFLLVSLLSIHSPFSNCIAFEVKVSANNDDQVPFSYIEATGRGPSRWGQLDPKWKACGNGKLQSPINLDDQTVEVVPEIGGLKPDYKAANATIISRGRDILVTWKGDAGKININGTDYNLQQCHWHTPSEHTLNGTRYDMELHILHASSSGETAVVGVLYQFGQPDPFLSTLFPYIKSVTKQEIDMGIVNPGKMELGSTKYYRYMGSLSVPPCTEGVLWTVMKKVKTVSKKQVQALKDAVDDGFQANARPIQRPYGRAVYLYKPWDIVNFA